MDSCQSADIKKFGPAPPPQELWNKDIFLLGESLWLGVAETAKPYTMSCSIIGWDHPEKSKTSAQRLKLLLYVDPDAQAVSSPHSLWLLKGEMSGVAVSATGPSLCCLDPNPLHTCGEWFL